MILQWLHVCSRQGEQEGRHARSKVKWYFLLQYIEIHSNYYLTCFNYSIASQKTNRNVYNLWKRYAFEVNVAAILLPESSVINLSLLYLRTTVILRHLANTALYCIQTLLGYFLMLVFMIYNVHLCISIVIGATLGFFCFRFRRPDVERQSVQHCDCMD